MDIGETLRITSENLKKLGNNEQLPCIEKYVEDEICALMDAEADIGECFSNFCNHIIPDEMSEEIDQLVQFQFSGSVVEGAIMARRFQKIENWNEVEFDIMCNLFTIPQEVNHLLEPVDDKPGFARIPFCQELCGNFYKHYAEEFLGISKSVQDPKDQMPKYISPILIKDLPVTDEWGILDSLIERAHSTGDREMEFVSREVLNTQSSASNTETTKEIKTKYGIPGDFRHLSIDLVPAVRLLFWPRQATAWITRNRLWPPQDTIQSIVDKGCQLVPRSSPGGDVHSEWRLSFSGPEAILAQLRSKKQKQAYYFFKIFFNGYLKCVESSEPERKPLYSYIIKTTMLWAFEELPPDDPIWASLETSVQILLFKLLGSLEVGFLSHYFIPEINLLERVRQDVRIKCASIISRWQNNILMTAPFDMKEKREDIKVIQICCSLFPYVCNFLKPILRTKLSELLKKTDGK